MSESNGRPQEAFTGTPTSTPHPSEAPADVAAANASTAGATPETTAGDARVIKLLRATLIPLIVIAVLVSLYAGWSIYSNNR